MLREVRPRNSTLGPRSVPSLARTVEALRAIRGKESRTGLEMRISVIRGGRQLT
jgi:hypothetical protein